jgi:hypothetical protein
VSFGLRAIDVTDPRSCLARVLSLGLRVERIDVWRGDRTTESRLRAPAGVWGMALDAPEGPWSRMWVRDACRSEEHVEAYRLLCRPELVAQRASIRRVDAAWDMLARCYPSPRVVDAVVASVLASARVEERAERLAAPAEVAAVLGWPLPRLRAAMKRGDVRSVPGPSGRRAIPWSEVERLVAETTTPGAGSVPPGAIVERASAREHGMAAHRSASRDQTMTEP